MNWRFLLLNRRPRGFYGPTWTRNPVTGIWTNTPSLGNEILSNPGFEAGDPPTSWAAYNAGTLASDAVIKRTGAASCKYTFNGSGTYGGITQTPAGTPFVVGKFYRVEGWVYGQNLGAASFFLNMASDLRSTAYSNGAWVNLSGIKRATTTGHTVLVYVYGNSASNANKIYNIDDMSVKLISDASLFLTRRYTWSIGMIAIPIANATGLVAVHGGGIACADSQTNPANYFDFYYGGDGKIYATKVIAGVSTAIITATTTTYHQNWYLVFKRTATKVQIFYNSAGNDGSGQVGADYTLVAGDPGGTIHGHFATDVSVLLGSGIFTGA
jgi:hypothetical protein